MNHRPSAVRALLSRAQAVRDLIRVTGDRDLAVAQRDTAEDTNRSLRAVVNRRDQQITDQNRRHQRLLDELSALLEEWERDGLSPDEVRTRARRAIAEASTRQELHAAVDSFDPAEALDVIQARTQEGIR
ncbi:hypothetical protein DQ384_26255 [Sphaerisporangium album]|uniref:Uncharacterized protein n=1 Tax=Sphaerisporangium album TaxID=509200 RepID=A0A367FA43_9ACTN|nr:hypothetical protein [Sphaerisporangium album]RCG27224.1 hypothetical protein DQ384_26255 [Sphaerisporangium album]